MKKLLAPFIVGMFLCILPTFSLHVYVDEHYDSIYKPRILHGQGHHSLTNDEVESLIKYGNLHSFLQKNRNGRKRGASTSPSPVGSKPKINLTRNAKSQRSPPNKGRNGLKKTKKWSVVKGASADIHVPNANIDKKTRTSRKRSSPQRKVAATKKGNRNGNHTTHITKTSNVRQHHARSVKTNPHFSYSAKDIENPTTSDIDDGEEEDTNESNIIDHDIEKDDGDDDEPAEEAMETHTEELDDESNEDQDNEDSSSEGDNLEGLFDLFEDVDDDNDNDDESPPRKSRVTKGSTDRHYPDIEKNEIKHKKSKKLRQINDDDSHPVDDTDASLSPLDSIAASGKADNRSSKSKSRKDRMSGRLSPQTKIFNEVKQTESMKTIRDKNQHRKDATPKHQGNKRVIDEENKSESKSADKMHSKDESRKADSNSDDLINDGENLPVSGKKHHSHSNSSLIPNNVTLSSGSDNDLGDPTLIEKDGNVKHDRKSGATSDSLDDVYDLDSIARIDGKGDSTDPESSEVIKKPVHQKDEGEESDTDDYEEFMFDDGDDDVFDYDYGEDDDGEDVDAFDSPLGLEYLGAGYDLVKGNPLGDTVTLLDPGFRANVIQMHWGKELENISNSLQYIQPNGVWIRSYISCHKGDTVSEVGTSDSFKKALAADAAVSAELPGDAVKFSASASYNNITKSEKKENQKTYVSKSYCFNYVAGIPISIKWDFTFAFEAAIKTLPKTFDFETEDAKCTPSDYRDNPRSKACVQLGIPKWMQFFSIFGTHVTTKVYLGGKLVTLVETNAHQEEKLASQGVDVQAAVSAQVKDSTINASAGGTYKNGNGSSKMSFDSKSSTFVLGGDIYGNGNGLPFNEWAESVAKLSMPIKAEYTPIFIFIDPAYRDAYKEAYLYYGKVLVGDNVDQYDKDKEPSK